MISSTTVPSNYLLSEPPTRNDTYVIPDTRVRHAGLFEVQKWTHFASSVCDFIFEFPDTSVESYARLWEKYAFQVFRIK